MPIRQLPARPNLEHLKNQAHALLRDRLAVNAEATSRFEAANIMDDKPKLADALHVIAREYGFDTWPALKTHVEMESDDAMEALTAAVRANDAALVSEAFKKHPSLKQKINDPLPNYGFDAPAIFAAVNHGNREMIDVLLDNGANINERTRWWAGSFGVLDSADLELADYLIARGAVVDIHAAARLGMIERVRAWLDSNPQLVNARGGDGQSPLHFAKTVAIAELLLERGAEIDLRDIDHESTALQYMVSIKPHRHDVAKLLVARGAKTDILIAAALGDMDGVTRLLDHDPDVIRVQVGPKNFPKIDPRAGGIIYIFGFGGGRTPHMVAHQFGHIEVYELLMRRSSPWLRLAMACEMHDEARVAQIVEQHPTVIAKLSPMAARRIIWATARNNTRAVEMLLRSGWPAAVFSDERQTPLHWAAWNGNVALVKALLDHGAPVNVFETEHGGSPLAWALHGSLNGWERAKGDYVGVTRVLLDAGAELPKTDAPLQATDEVLAIVRELRSATAATLPEH